MTKHTVHHIHHHYFHLPSKARARVTRVKRFGYKLKYGLKPRSALSLMRR